MSPSAMKSTPSRSTGLTMIEMLVAMALALTMMLIITTVFSGAKASFQLQDGLTRVQEDGRIAMHLVSEQVRLAGFRQPVWNDPAIGYAPLSAASVNGASGANDTLQFMYFDATDCNGTVETTVDPETNEALANYKRITFDVNAGVLRMSCDYGTDPGDLTAQVTNQAVIDGVESFQILYGVDTDFPPDFSVNAWTTADTITPSTTVCLQSRYLCEADGLINDMTDGVPVSLKIGMLLTSPDAAESETTDESFTVLDVTVVPLDDKRVRKAFTSTIALRNLTL